MIELCNREELHLDLQHLLETYSRFGPMPFEFPVVPERDPRYKGFRVARMNKRGAKKKKMGSVWVETDPSAILLNKLIIRSCHTINNIDHDLRGGNFNYLYIPQMVSLFAGTISPNDDKSIIPAISKFGNEDINNRNGENYKIRKHQAVCNLWLCRGNVLYASKLYDSASQEDPWAQTMFDYLKNTAKRLKLNLVMCQDWQRRIKAENFYDDLSVRVSTEKFNLPFVFKDEVKNIHYYGDDSLAIYKDGKNRFYMGAAGYLVHVADEDEPTVHIPYYSDGHDNDDGFQPNAFFKCCNCGVVEDIHKKTNVGSDRDEYCKSCISSNFIRCESCCNYHQHEDVMDVPMEDGKICTYCFNRLFFTCIKCGEFKRSAGKRANGECTTCFREYAMGVVAEMRSALV